MTDITPENHPVGLAGVPLAVEPLKRRDFASDQEVRWCPGCGDYAILSTFQGVLPDLGIAKENAVVISGIGCSSRFPYYMSTYGMHSIHGRAPAIATGVAVSRPDLAVFVITGDGDALASGRIRRVLRAIDELPITPSGVRTRSILSPLGRVQASITEPTGSGRAATASMPEAMPAMRSLSSTSRSTSAAESPASRARVTSCALAARISASDRRTAAAMARRAP